MNIAALCIKRPALTIVISLVLTIIGILGFINLPLRWIPNVTPPEVYIMTEYPGANARLVERDITKVIEGGLSGINGIESLSSTSSRNDSQISIVFKLGTNMDASVEDVRTAVERVRSELPKDARNPSVVKAHSGRQALLYMAFSDQYKSVQELSDYVDKYIVPVFETVDGVANIRVHGQRVPAIKINLDPAKMAGANVTVDEVTQMLAAQNISVPSGHIRGKDRYYSVLTNSTLSSAAQFNDLIVHDQNNQMVRIKDIGLAEVLPEDDETLFRVGGKPALAIGIVPQSTANPLDVEKNIQKTLQAVKRTLPAGMHANIAFNLADYIRASIHSVYESFFESIIFVWLVILLFLSSFRATLIPIVTIPVCLISTFSILHFFGFSINTITLMAFVLAIGLVVDDAIVMLENISRHIESGLSVFAAAIKGSGEMIFPIIAMTVTLAAVYAPIAFTPGLLGVLFKEFTFTLAGAVLISGIVALTLSPMMCARVLKPMKPTRYSQWLTDRLQRLQHRYQTLLHYLLKKRLWVIISLLVVGGAGFMLFKFIPSELAPSEDMNQLYVSVTGPRNASFKYTAAYSQQLEPIFAKYPEIETYLSMMFSSSNSFHILTLKPKNQRTLSTAALIKELNTDVSKITGVRVNVFPPQPPLANFSGSDEGDNLGLIITTSSDYQKLQQSVQHLADAIRKLPGFTHVENGLKWDSEQFQIDIDREKAADLHVPISNITNTIATLLAGKNIGKTDDVNVFVQMEEGARSSAEIFNQLYVRNNENRVIPLTSLIDVRATTAPDNFTHYERLRADTIYLSLAPDFKVSEAIKVLEKIAKSTLPDDMKFTFTGEAKSFLESKGKTIFTFALALLFIYLVLAAQFESFIDPLIILFTVPFAIIGAMVSLKLFGGTLNIYSNIGLITLIGLIAKHGILITEFANRLRAEGKSIQEAITTASMLRLRPILMTTAAMVLGALPLAFAFGPGAESRQQIGLVIAGGLIFGTFFSLVVVPIIYTYLTPWRRLGLGIDQGK